MCRECDTRARRRCSPGPGTAVFGGDEGNLEVASTPRWQFSGSRIVSNLIDDLVDLLAAVGSESPNRSYPAHRQSCTPTSWVDAMRTRGKAQVSATELQGKRMAGTKAVGWQAAGCDGVSS
jgi:hypothetical protein